MNKLLKALSSISLCFFLIFCLVSDLLAKASYSSPVSPPPSISSLGLGQNATVPPCWAELTERLSADGFRKEDLCPIFIELGDSYSEKPMQTKLAELHKKYTTRHDRAPKPAKGNVGRNVGYYRHVLTNKNIVRAKSFITSHKTAFDKANQEFGVPAEVAAALLLVETDLGQFLGNEKALLNLASMAASSKAEDMLPHFPVGKNNLAWMQKIMTEKSDWAYTELKALLTYSFENGLDPLQLTGSIYGAIGLCQFMPSNISLYGKDGTGNGQINLFVADDAIHSLANYLKEHGWQKNLSRSEQHQVLLNYNRSSTYANTILLAADHIAGRKTLNSKGKKAQKNPFASHNVNKSGKLKQTPGKK